MPTRLSLSDCREYVSIDVTDEELKIVRDALYVIARLVCSAPAKTVREQLYRQTSERYDLEERAAIMEFDGGVPRELAEQMAAALTA